MAGIKDIYRSTDAFRFPTWDHAVSYPANSVVAYYDSEFDRWAHYIAIQQTIPGSLDSDEIRTNEWVEMSFDSDTLYRYALRALNDSLDEFKGYLQPRVDSDVLVFLDSEFSILAANVDSDVKQTLTIHRDSDSDMRVAFEARLIDIIESNDSDLRTEVDSDISNFRVAMVDHDSDIQYHAHRIDNFWDHLDSDVNYLKTIYGNAVALSLQNANKILTNTNDITGNKANSDSDIAALYAFDATIASTYQTKVDADSDKTAASIDVARVNDLDSDTQKVKNDLADFNNATEANFDSEYRARKTADDANKLELQNDYNQKFANVDSDINRVELNVSSLAASIVGGAIGGTGQVDSEWVLSQVSGQQYSSQVDSDWVERQIIASGAAAGAGERLFFSGTIPAGTDGTNDYVIKNWGAFTGATWGSATHAEFTLSIVRSNRTAYRTYKYEIQFNDSTDPGAILWTDNKGSVTTLGISGVNVLTNAGGALSTNIDVDTETGELNWYLYGYKTVI